MSEQPLRFLHASDFRLDEPLAGIPELPSELIDLLADAPYLAAEKVFDAALIEEVDFLLLCGNLLDPFRAGPRGLVFLWEQFRRLEQRDVAVYWAASDRDQPDQWPPGFELPSNVHIFSSTKVEDVSHFRDDSAVATLMGRSGTARPAIRAAEYQGDSGGLFTVAAAVGQAEAKALTGQRVNYWALGGQMQRETLCTKPRSAHFPGGPQGRRQEHSGPHGATLVQVDRGGRLELQSLTTDALCWTAAHVSAPREGTLPALENSLNEHARRLGIDSDRPQLVTWHVTGVERLKDAARDGLWRDTLATRLRKEHGATSAVWTVSIEPELPESPPESWLQENTLLGDFLRELTDFEIQEAEERPLRERLAELGVAGELPDACDLSDREEQKRVLREAGKLGADLLRGKT